IARVELSIDVAQVEFHRRFAHAELEGRDLVRVAFAQATQNLPFALSEWIRPQRLLAANLNTPDHCAGRCVSDARRSGPAFELSRIGLELIAKLQEGRLRERARELLAGCLEVTAHAGGVSG